MKNKKIIVKIQDLDESLTDFAKKFEEAKKNKKIKPESSISFCSVELFRKFFSKKRLELLKVVKQTNPKSIYHLAKITNREYKNVYDDISLLEELGLIKKIDKEVKLNFKKLNIEVSI